MSASEALADDYITLLEVRRDWSPDDQRRFARELVDVVWGARSENGVPLAMRYEIGDYQRAAEMEMRECVVRMQANPILDVLGLMATIERQWGEAPATPLEGEQFALFGEVEAA